jgi:oxaloacetate decarboxylase gamma subunit
MQDTLIDQGISLMLYGMGTVFVFLTILVFATGLMSKIVHGLTNNEAQEGDSPPAPIVTTPSSSQPSRQVLQAIKLAIAEHRKP